MIIDDHKERRTAIANRIKQLRIKAGYTSYENFATDHGMSRRNYWAIENGNNFKLDTLFKLTKIFGITLEEFFKGLE